MTLILNIINLLPKRPPILLEKVIVREVKFLKLNKRSFSTSPFNSQSRWTRGRSKKVPSLEPPFEEGLPLQGTGSPSSQLFKPFLFTVAFSSASISAAAIWQYENIRARTTSRMQQSIQWFHDQRNHFQKKQGKWRNDFNRWWHGLSEAEKIFIPLCLANCAVFLAWRVPAFQPVMLKYFCSNPASSAACWPMVLSVFSHYSAFHLLANMYVLHSFSNGAVLNMGKEQFLGFYMAAGVISSMASYIHKVLLSKPGLSLGASGAIMGVLGYTCSQYPDLDLNIIIFPFFTFKAAAALKVIMGIDAMGIIMGWKLFDHAAHLGGALFGVFWSYWGYQHIWRNRKPLVDMWHNMRGPT